MNNFDASKMSSFTPRKNMKSVKASESRDNSSSDGDEFMDENTKALFN